MKYLLDTNVVSETRRPRPDPGVLAWLASISPSDLAISVVTIGEIQKGIEKIRSQDEQKARELESWLDDIVRTGSILGLSATSMRIRARIMHKRPSGYSEDAMIAATAIEHSLVVVTRNVAGLELLGAEVLNPFARDPAGR